MSNSMQATNNVNKVQTPANNGKSNPNKKDSELNFNDLFSSALGQNAPTAQLNSIESQLRESLFKQEKTKKSTESNPGAEAAQAAVWAQRNWMQAADGLNLGSQPGGLDSPKAAAPIAPTTAPQRPAEQNDSQPAASAPNQSPTQNTTASDAQNAPQSAPAVPVSNGAQTGTVPASESSDFKGELNGALSGAVSGALNTAPNSDSKLAAMAAETMAQTSDTTASVVGNSLATANGADSGRAEQKTATQMKADAVLANGNISNRTEPNQTNSAGNPSGAANANLGNGNSVAAQLGSQIAQQAQALGKGISDGTLEGLGEEGLKVGQKILAAGGLQSAGTPTGIAAGTNGLTGGTGTAQQALIKTPVNQAGFAKEMGQTVQWAIGKNLSTVDIRVNPESFGPMNMRLVQKGQQIQLIIRTQDEASANLLTQALGGLKEVLAQNGLQLNQVQIQNSNTPTPQGQANGQTGDQANNGQAQFEQNHEQGRGGQRGAGGDKGLQDSTPAGTATTGRKPEGSLDLFA